MKNNNQKLRLNGTVIGSYLQYMMVVLNEEILEGYSRLRHYICKKSKEIYFLLLHSLRSFVLEMKLKLNIGSNQSVLGNTNLKVKDMKSSALNNGIKVTAGSFVLYGLLIVALWSVKSLVPNSAILLSGDSGRPMMNQRVMPITTQKDTALVLNMVHMFNKSLLHVSLNTTEMGEGKLRIIDINGKEVLSSNIEIIRYPYYATVDVTGLSAGSYVVVVKSAGGVHSAGLIIE